MLEKLRNTETVGWITDSKFISSGISLKDSASDFRLISAL